ncbi:unnamed protein product, partial [Discosporangium mesarthrocarpum]
MGMEDVGFFSGTGQLALRPNAVTRRALHPVFAPPIPCSPEPSAILAALRETGGAWLPESCAQGALGQQEGNKYAVAGGYGRNAGGRGRGCLGEGPGGTAGKIEAAQVVGVLPPLLVLERCLMVPLRTHCRLARTACLQLFLEDLGLLRLTEVLRAVFLSPSGSSSDSPLGHYKNVLFGCLQGPSPHLQVPQSEGEGGQGWRGGTSGGVFEGVVVRDVPTFLE